MIFNKIGQSANLFEVYADEPAYKPAVYKPNKPTYFFKAGKEHIKPDHMQDFLTSVRTREKTQCNEDEAFIEAAVLLMSIESYKQQRQVRWDPVAEKII